MSAKDNKPAAGHPAGWDKMAVPTGTSAIMTPAMARAVAAAPRKVDDEPLVAAPALTELADAASQALAQIGGLRGELQGMRSSAVQASALGDLSKVAAALDELEFPAAKTGGWWPIGRGKEKEAFEQFQQKCLGLVDQCKTAQASFKALAQQVRERAGRASRVRTQLEVDCHAVEQVVDKGRRKAGGVVEALKRQAALAVEDGDKLRRIEEVRVLTDQFAARIEPMARVAASAARVTTLLKGVSVTADIDRREGKFSSTLEEWEQAAKALESTAPRMMAAKEAAEALSVECGKAVRYLQAMLASQKELDAACDELAQALAGVA